MRAAAVLACLAALVGCRFNPSVPTGTIVTCKGDSDCPQGKLCRASIGQCVAAALAEPRCGDGVVDVGEACDDGNAVDDDACTNRCALPTCGDGVLQTGEACDDGNQSNGDACLNTCVPSSCGDAFVQAGEECDTGPANADGTFCTSACLKNVCGDGLLFVGAELCDDGNRTSGDGCRADCAKLEVCGDRVVDQGEQCDDGNHNPLDGCDACGTTAWNASLTFGLGPQAAPTTSLGYLAAVAADTQDNCYVADGNRRVLKVSPGGTVVLVAGTGLYGFGGDNGPSTNAVLSDVSGLAVDALGRVYLADTYNHRIRRVEADGTIVTVAGNGTSGFGGDTGPAIAAQLSLPFGVAVDGVGRIYIADTNNHRIRLVDLDGTIRTLAGNGSAAYGGDGAAATAASLQHPQAVGLDAQGRVVIADTVNHRLRRVDVAGVITTIAGTGAPGFSGDNGSATAAQLQFPGSVAFDPLDRVVFADTANQRVRRVEANGTIVTIAGTGTMGFSGDLGAATAARIWSPAAAAVSPGGTMFIADTINRRVRKVDPSGTIDTLVGTGANNLGDGAAATSATLWGPEGLTFDSTGAMYLCEFSNGRVRKVTPDGTISTALPMANATDVAIDGQGQVYVATMTQVGKLVDGGFVPVAGTGATGFNGDGQAGTVTQVSFASAMVFDSQGRLVFADSGNHRVRRVESNGTVTTIVGTGVAAYSGEGLAATASAINFPKGLAYDGQGRLVISESGNARIRRVELNGTLVTLAGTDGGVTSDGVPATSVTLQNPLALTLDPQGRVVFAESGAHRVRRLEADGTLSTVAGTGAYGTVGEGGPAIGFALAFPYGVAFDPAGRLHVTASSTNRAARVESTGVTRTVAGAVDPQWMGPFSMAQLPAPAALAQVTPGLALATSPSQGLVLSVSLDAGVLQPVVGRYGQTSPTADLARFRDTSFGAVTGVAWDGATHTVYLTETSRHRVHAVTATDLTAPESWTIAVLAGDPSQAAAVNGTLAQARFSSPTGLMFHGPSRTLYVADTGNHCVRAIDLSAGQVRTTAGTCGTFGNSDGVPATSAGLFQPRAVVVTPNGDLFIADTGNQRIRRVAASSQLLTTVLGDGSAASSGEGSPARAFPVDTPAGLATDALGNLFITSSTAVRMLPADDLGVVDGSGPALTLYGAQPRTTFPASATSCLAGVSSPVQGTLLVADGCAGFLVKLSIAPWP